ncbi:MAG: acetate/propionate family kinase [Gammaproteobacteria bacterium]|jgi:acetate kinase
MNPADHQADLHCLCVNSGSSSLKVALYRIGHDSIEHRLWHAAALEIGTPQSRVERKHCSETHSLPDHRAALDVLLRKMETTRVDAVGHRVVHGGERTRPERVTPDLLARLHALIPLAPLHLPAALAGIAAVGERLPDVPQVACFDSAFHAGLPAVASTLPLPHHLRALGIRRYGFHGLSCEYIVSELGGLAQGRIVVAHLGNGASLTAIMDGESVDTTMSFTPTGGVMMGTRSGDLDPGVLLYLMREQGFDAAALESLLNHEAGLLGVSGLTPDMSVLLGRDEPGARLAVSLFAYQVRKALGALSAALGGLDRLVFTGGIGEHAAPVRGSICSGLDYLGIRLDAARNAANAQCISADGSSCEVLVIPTDEDRIIARHCRRLLTGTDNMP